MKMLSQEAEAFFSELYFGKHHLPAGGIKPFGEGWSVNHYAEVATFDFDTLTRLVFLAHDKCIRVSIMQGGPGAIKIVLYKRDKRKGSIMESHPTIENALKKWRMKHEAREKKIWREVPKM